MRQRYYVVASGLFIIIGVVILMRAILAGVPVIGILGAVFIALGVVRLRDYARFTREGRQ
jgi:uncharacterized membrane protein HdeD (DUF308 family)